MLGNLYIFTTESRGIRQYKLPIIFITIEEVRILQFEFRGAFPYIFKNIPLEYYRALYYLSNTERIRLIE